MAKSRKLEESDWIKELDLLKEWAEKGIVYPLAFGLKEEVSKAYNLIKSCLNELKEYRNKR